MHVIYCTVIEINKKSGRKRKTHIGSYGYVAPKGIAEKFASSMRKRFGDEYNYKVIFAN